MKKLVQAAYFSDRLVKKEPHYHDCHQIILILSGEAEIRVKEELYRAGTGSVVLFSRYEDHAIVSGGYERYVLQLEPTAVHRNDRLYSLLFNRPKGFRNILDVSAELQTFRQLLQQITEEAAADREMGAEMQALLVEELLILLHRRMPVFLPEQAELVLDLQQRFEQHYGAPYSLPDLAKEYNVSPSTLSHRFKEVTGVPVMEYLLSCRLAAAKNHLIGTDLSVGQIVELCGFSDSSNFSRTFRRQTGLSPTAFRRKYRVMQPENS